MANPSVISKQQAGAGRLVTIAPEMHAMWLKAMERVRRLMGGKPPAVQCAALPWRRTEDGRVQVMIATSRDTGRWVLPKGWPHKRLTLEQSAAQEAYEEVGVVGDISKVPFGTYLYNKVLDNGLSKRVQVSVFPMEVRGRLDDWPERDQRDIAWVDADEAARLVDEPELARLLRKFRG